MVLTVDWRYGWIAGAVLLVLVLAFFLNRRQPDYIPPDDVWAAAEREGETRGLDPRFLFAIAMAESSLNAHADSGYARGLMQVSRAAWRDTTDRSYREAFQWRRNLTVAADYLAHLRARLEEAGQFDHARLAAAYRYGYAALLQAGFAVEELPPNPNTIYQQLFAGTIPDPENYGVTERDYAIPEPPEN